MVNFKVVANNEKDPFVRVWILSIDQLPPVDWPLSAHFDGTSFVQNKSQGELMQTNLNLPDGKHTVYFATSAPKDGSFGRYSGGIQMDGVSGEFTGVDVDTVGAFEIEVKDNKAVKRVNQRGQDLVDDSKTAALKQRFAKAKATLKDHATLVAGAGAFGVIIIFGSLIGVNAMQKRRRL